MTVPFRRLVGRLVEVTSALEIVEPESGGASGLGGSVSERLMGLIGHSPSGYKKWVVQAIVCAAPIDDTDVLFNGPYRYYFVELDDVPTLSPLVFMSFNTLMHNENDTGSKFIESCRTLEVSPGLMRRTFGRVVPYSMPKPEVHNGQLLPQIGQFNITGEVMHAYTTWLRMTATPALSEAQLPVLTDGDVEIDSHADTDAYISANGWNPLSFPTLSHRMASSHYLELCRRLPSGHAWALERNLSSEEMSEFHTHVLVRPLHMWLSGIIDTDALMLSTLPAYMAELPVNIQRILHEIGATLNHKEVLEQVENMYHTYVLPMCETFRTHDFQLPSQLMSITEEGVLLPSLPIRVLEAMELIQRTHNTASVEHAAVPTFSIAVHNMVLELTSGLTGLYAKHGDWQESADWLQHAVHPESQRSGIVGVPFLWVNVNEPMPSVHVESFVPERATSSPTGHRNSLSMGRHGGRTLDSFSSTVRHRDLVALYTDGLVLTQAEASNESVLVALIAHFFAEPTDRLLQVTLANLNLWTDLELSRVIALLALQQRRPLDGLAQQMRSGSPHCPFRLVVTSQVWGFDFGACNLLESALTAAQIRHRPAQWAALEMDCLPFVTTALAKPEYQLAQQQVCWVNNSQEELTPFTRFFIDGPLERNEHLVALVFATEALRVRWALIHGVDLCKFEALNGLNVDQRAALEPFDNVFYAPVTELVLDYDILFTLRSASRNPVLLCSTPQHLRLLHARTASELPVDRLTPEQSHVVGSPGRPYVFT